MGLMHVNLVGFSIMNYEYQRIIFTRSMDKK